MVRIEESNATTSMGGSVYIQAMLTDSYTLEGFARAIAYSGHLGKQFARRCYLEICRGQFLVPVSAINPSPSEFRQVR